jgi:hypothetical protein
LIEIDVRAGVSGRLAAEDHVNALVKQVHALLTVGYFALQIPVHRWANRLAEALLTQGVVGAGGVEPPSSSVSAKHREPLC